MDLKKREAREIDAFDKELANFRVSDETLVIPKHDVERYCHPTSKNRFRNDVILRILGDVHGRRILDIGCGTGFWSTILGLRGAQVTAIDISELHVKVAARRIKVNGLENRVKLLQASVHDLPFASETFDFVFGIAILHHVDARTASLEIRRVLRQPGSAVFLEPLALSLLLRRIRKTRLVTKLVKENRVSPDEEPLTQRQIDTIADGFSAVRTHEFEMLSRLERILGTGKPYRLLYDLDTRLLQFLPPLRRFARYAIIELIK